MDCGTSMLNPPLWGIKFPFDDYNKLYNPQNIDKIVRVLARRKVKPSQHIRYEQVEMCFAHISNPVPLFFSSLYAVRL